MAVPSLPAKGSTDWYAHYAALDLAVRRLTEAQLNVKDFGAVGDGVADDSDAIKAAFTAAINARGGLGSTDSTVVRHSLYFPPGTYRVTKADSLIYSPITGSSDQIFGLQIEGAGARVSEIFFDTNFTDSGDPRQNNLITAAARLRYTYFRNISFRSSNPANNFAYFWSVAAVNTGSVYPNYGYGQNQYQLFENVEWSGRWNRGIGIDGDRYANNNSEWTWRNCSTEINSTFADAFLHVGITNPDSNTQQDQFLNFWFEDCNWALAGGIMLLFDRGGSISVRGGSWSMVGTNPATYFKMNRMSDISAMRVYVEGVRFEPKAAGQRIIDCAWEMGNVTFISCSDMAALQYLGAANFDLHRYAATSNNWTPIVRYMDCALAGYHTVTTNASLVTKGKIIYEGCNVYHWDTATGNNGFLRATNAGFPRYAFRDCWNIADASG